MNRSPFDIPEWYEDDNGQEYLPPISPANPSPHQQLIPQIWAEIIEKSLRRRLDILGQELLDASLSKNIYG